MPWEIGLHPWLERRFDSSPPSDAWGNRRSPPPSHCLRLRLRRYPRLWRRQTTANSRLFELVHTVKITFFSFVSVFDTVEGAPPSPSPSPTSMQPPMARSSQNSVEIQPKTMRTSFGKICTATLDPALPASRSSPSPHHHHCWMITGDPWTSVKSRWGGILPIFLFFVLRS